MVQASFFAGYNWFEGVDFYLKVNSVQKDEFIWKWCTNTPGMSPKSFRKISYQEQEISLYWPYFNKEISQLMD